MNKNEDYINGPHNFWIHFLCGLVFGTLIGAWLSVQVFETPSLILISTGACALIVAFSCARWGDAVWHWLLRRVAWMD